MSEANPVFLCTPRTLLPPQGWELGPGRVEVLGRHRQALDFPAPVNDGPGDWPGGLLRATFFSPAP